MSLNYFDGILYINLTHREDRKKSILNELKFHNADKKKIHRISARYAPFNGHKGCVLSHIDALDFATEKKWKNVLILEDDCFFLKNKEFVNGYINYHTTITQNNWDILFLGCKVLEDEKSSYPHIRRVLKCYRSHAYVVNEHYYKTLKENYLESYRYLKNYLFHLHANIHTLDKRWETLLKKDRWYVGETHIAGQRTNFSDIEIRRKKRDLIKKSSI